MKKITAGLIFILCFCAPASFADSLWGENSSSPYTTQRAYRPNDIINVIILESTSAVSEAGTQTHVKDDLGANFAYALSGLYSRSGGSARGTAGWENRYGGLGKTSRASNVQARVAAKVTEVMPNGLVRITGTHVVDVNREKQTIFISGIIRTSDINVDNTIFSYQVADAEIVVRGTGAVAEAEQPGWFTRFFNWLF